MTEAEEAPGYPYARVSPFDPPPEFARWHARSPMTRIVLWNGRRAWLVTGLEEVRTAMAGVATFVALAAAEKLTQDRASGVRAGSETTGQNEPTTEGAPR